ncbi:hypothetical protein SAMN05443572_105606 [Myxococcus fulvus]|uniref:DUF4168 domain-containing protein n=1 Tax=Myxococcus fulvus TaxID=33 RepID=A0A511T5B8_MYXFU|nr:hypothetical protein [Myxococcus fulvus]AKF86517.1 hypothetical protein MFUL124B02_28320 [Myxococcus fulvus 124B02]GEN09351.1 hypothetical protein MFU01_43880 [Myxococcus fulvus]SEU17526.1 hypothetical protein SAMN05443572_105606 [Myxococcus fulvus]
MSRPISMLIAALLVVPGGAGAQEGGEMTPEKVAHIRRDEAAAMKQVDEEFGNRKPSEMSNEERGQASRKQAAVTASVMEKHGVTAKEYERFTAKMGQEGNERAKAEAQRLEDQAKAAAARQAAAAKASEEKEVSVQKGFDNENPVELESSGNDGPEVEIGIPVEDEAGGEGGEGVETAEGAGGGAVGADAAASAEDNVQVEVMGDGDAKPAKKAVRRASSESSKAKKKFVRKKKSSGD